MVYTEHIGHVKVHRGSTNGGITSNLGTKYLDQAILYCEGQGRPDIVKLNKEVTKINI